MVGNFSHDKKAKCPTVVMLNEDKIFDSFGYKAEEHYAKMVKKKTHLKCYRFRDFKMKLYNEKVYFIALIIKIIKNPTN